MYVGLCKRVFECSVFILLGLFIQQIYKVFKMLNLHLRCVDILYITFGVTDYIQYGPKGRFLEHCKFANEVVVTRNLTLLSLLELKMVAKWFKIILIRVKFRL